VIDRWGTATYKSRTVELSDLLGKSFVIDQPARDRGYTLAYGCAALTILLGVLALAGRIFGATTLFGLSNAQLQMKANTAFGFILIGVSLICLIKPRRNLVRLSGQVLAFFIIVLGAASLYESISGLDLGIDELIVRDEQARQAGARPGLMVPVSAINFMLKGLALLLLDWSVGRGIYLSQWLSAVSVLAPVQVAIAYSHGMKSILGVGHYPYLTQMSPHTALAWILLSIGTLSSRPTYGFMAPLFVESRSSRPFRRMLALAVAVPIFLAWITTSAENWSLYYPGFGGSLFTVMIIIFLVTVIWKTYCAILQYELELGEAIRARDEFFSIASHELKTPLTALKLRLQMAKMPAENSLVDRVAASVDDMLDISRIRSGKFNFDFEITDLSLLVRKTADAYSSQIAAANCTLNLQIADGLKLKCDERRIEQVLLNLLNNAVKYAAGSKINLTLLLREPNLVLEVSDLGKGIPIEKQAAIFERFERVGDSTGIEGLGLGLYICKNIVEGHRGTIRVESTPGAGATFIVELPRQ
jgi:signal transduction histidine kinase